jgi:WhiB family redox-sensing transcriptional regulator
VPVGITYQDWRIRAACRGPRSEVFYPPATGERRDEKLLREHMAKAICGGCAVRGQCLKFAVERGEAHGIWGGTSESERRVLIGAA